MFCTNKLEYNITFQHTISYEVMSYFNMLCKGDHFRFGSVFTHKKQPNRKKKTDPKLNRNRPKPTGFGSVFDAQNRKNLYAFFWAS
jgi:hypothetical protein